MLACFTLPVSVLSNYWEWTTVDVDILKQIKLQHGVQASALVEDRLFLITKEGQAMSEKVWLNNPNILANTNSGLWSSCLSMSGENYVFPGKLIIQDGRARFADLFTFSQSFFSRYPSSDSSYSIVRKKLTANSHFTFQINNSTSELLESF